MKLLLLFITIIFCIIQNVIAIYNKDIFLPKCDSLYIEKAYIGPNKEEHVRRCRYRPDRNRIYCDFSWDTNLYLSIPVKVYKSPTIKDGIKVNRFSLKRCNNKITRSLAVTSIGEKIEKGDTYKISNGLFECQCVYQYFYIDTNQGEIVLYYDRIYVDLY